MARVHIPRLDLDLKGVDAAVAREALDRLPAQLSSALRSGRVPSSESGTVSLQVPAHVDAVRLAARLAAEIASIVRSRTRLSGPGSSGWATGRTEPGA